MQITGINDKNVKVILKNIDETNNWFLYCIKLNLVSISIPENVKFIRCYDNNFNRSLVLPKSIENVVCDSKALDNLNKYKHIQNIRIYYE